MPLPTTTQTKKQGKVGNSFKIQKAVKPNPCPIGTSFIYHTIFLLRYTVCTVRYIPAGGFYGYSVFRTIVSSMYHTGIYLLRVANM